MSIKSDVIYIYDGSYPGLLCCVYQAFARKEDPMLIWSFDQEQPCLYPVREIKTAPEQADRVQGGIHYKLGFAAERWVWDTWYSDLENRETAILDFLKFGFRQGPSVMGMSGHPMVAPVFAASRALRNEAHLLTGFVRFSQIGGVLVSTVQPKNFVLPFLESHFTERLPREQFIIYDQTHHCALIYAHEKSKIVDMENLELPAPTQKEQNWACLWKQFYDTVEIQQRHNPRCQMTHIPKRYWSCVQELTDKPELLTHGKLPVSVQQALKAGELRLSGENTADAPAFLTPTQASTARALPIDQPVPALSGETG